MLTLSSLLSITALRADVDVVADAINDSDLETLRILVTVGTTHNHSFTVTQAQKEKYKELAVARVNKCKEDCANTTSFNTVLGFDWLSLGAYVALTGSGILAIHDCVKNDAKPEKSWKTWSGFGAFLYGFGNTLRSVKDVIKHSTEHKCKVQDALKKAEKVAVLVNSIPVSK